MNTGAAANMPINWLARGQKQDFISEAYKFEVCVGMYGRPYIRHYMWLYNKHAYGQVYKL